jgi:hypothetical protein
VHFLTVATELMMMMDIVAFCDVTSNDQANTLLVCISTLRRYAYSSRKCK